MPRISRPNDDVVDDPAVGQQPEVLEDHGELAAAQVAQRAWRRPRGCPRPRRRSRPAVGSISRVRHRTSVDLPEPDRPMTTKTSPGETSKFTSRTAAVHPVRSISSRRVRPHSSSELRHLVGLRPEHLPQPAHGDDRGASESWGVPRRCGTSVCVGGHDRPLFGVQPRNQCCGRGWMFCQMCLGSRYSSRPVGPSSRPTPECPKPPHSACGT